MRVLKECEVRCVGAGKIHFTLNLGTVIAGVVTGAVMLGPVGIGIALCGVVIGQGVNNLNDLFG